MDENRHRKIYAGVYYGMKALCLLLWGLAGVGSAIGFALAVVGVVREARGAGPIFLEVLMIAAVGFGLAVCVLAVIRLVWWFRAIGSYSTELMAWSLGLAGFVAFANADRLLAALHGSDWHLGLRTLSNGNVLVGGFLTYLAASFALAAIARRAQRQSLEAIPPG